MRIENEPLVRAILEAFPGARILTQREKLMVDPSPHEIDAIMAASTPAGEYLESIGKTDLATMSEDDWYCFLEVVVTAYQDHLQAIHSAPMPETAE